jgi:hypothetical protein
MKKILPSLNFVQYKKGHINLFPLYNIKKINKRKEKKFKEEKKIKLKIS